VGRAQKAAVWGKRRCLRSGEGVREAELGGGAIQYFLRKEGKSRGSSRGINRRKTGDIVQLDLSRTQDPNRMNTKVEGIMIKKENL